MLLKAWLYDAINIVVGNFQPITTMFDFLYNSRIIKIIDILNTMEKYKAYIE